MNLRDIRTALDYLDRIMQTEAHRMKAEARGESLEHLLAAAEQRAEKAEQRIRNLEHQVAELRRCNSRQAETIREATERARVATVAAHSLRRQTPDRAQHTLGRIRAARDMCAVWIELGLYFGMKPEEAGMEARARRTGTERTAERHAQTAEATARKLAERLAVAEEEHGLTCVQFNDAAAARDRFEAAWQNARLRAKQAKARESRANERAERHRATRQQWVSLANAATEKASDRARQAGKRADTAEATVSRVRVLAHRMRAGSPQGAAAIYAERIEQALDNNRSALDTPEG